MDIFWAFRRPRHAIQYEEAIEKYLWSRYFLLAQLVSRRLRLPPTTARTFVSPDQQHVTLAGDAWGKNTKIPATEVRSGCVLCNFLTTSRPITSTSTICG